MAASTLAANLVQEGWMEAAQWLILGASLLLVASAIAIAVLATDRRRLQREIKHRDDSEQGYKAGMEVRAGRLDIYPSHKLLYKSESYLNGYAMALHDRLVATDDR